MILQVSFFYYTFDTCFGTLIFTITSLTMSYLLRYTYTYQPKLSLFHDIFLIYVGVTTILDFRNLTSVLIKFISCPLLFQIELNEL